MPRIRRCSRLFLWIHLFVCTVWLYLFQTSSEPPHWMIHIFLWSILGVQFTWGLTVGLMVGPNRRCRRSLWWSLLLIFMPMYFFGAILKGIYLYLGAFWAAGYLAVFTALLACETYCGVMLGAWLHSLWRDR